MNIGRLRWTRRLPWTGWLAMAILAIYGVVSVFASVIAPFPPDEIFVASPFDPPSWEYWLGTDGLGRDIFSRLVYGGRTILWTAAGASAISVVFGGLLGLWLGYRRGRVDEAVMRLLEIIMSIPSIILALLVLGLFGPSPVLVTVIAGVLQIPSVARVIRAATLTVVEEDFIAAARACGEGQLSIALRELLPNVMGVFVVEFSIRCGFSALFIASLGFLGFGAPPPSPDWGLMINEGRNSLDQSVWMVVAPATGIAVLVISINLLTEGLPRATGYPHQFSGGQQQRITLALALCATPDLLILDEPSTGQDAVIRQEIVALLRDIAAEGRTAMLFILHNLATISELCDRIVVMRLGRVVEDGTANRVFGAPQYPYTRALLQVAPRVEI